MAKYTREEEAKILQDAFAASKRGDEAEYYRILKLLPLAPLLAKFAKENWGKEGLLEAGFDLSLADEKFGPGWLDR
jgi:hypothetical protein